jgi:hypothetical protein
MNKINLKLLLLISLFLLNTLSSCKQKNSKDIIEKGTNNINFIYPMALRGEMANVLNALDTIKTETLDSISIIKKNAIENRFLRQEEVFDYNTNDVQIIEIVDMFHNYWKSVMLNKQKTEYADSIFKTDIADFLFKNRIDPKWERDGIVRELYKYSNTFFEKKRYHSNAFGKTSHLYDLFLWKTDDIREYPIELINDSVVVEIHFMKDFISQGWTHYATLGRNYASGWATNKALFAMEDAYDLNSEDFKVSYLTHEGQHFSDYKKFPNLEQTDLEYRAKLVELVKSDLTTINIIGKFIRNNSDSKNNAHAFANYMVIKNLSQTLFKSEFVTEKEKWISIDKNLIQETAKSLFNKNTNELENLGALTVKSLITN